MNENTKIPILVTAVIGSSLLGVILGSRTGGEYIFEIGENLLTAIVFFFTFAFCFSIGLFYLERLKIKLNKND